MSEVEVVEHDSPAEAELKVILHPVTVRKGDRIRLLCGHQGRVVWISADRTAYAVRGVRRRCAYCGKGSNTTWRPNVYLMTQDEA